MYAADSQRYDTMKYRKSGKSGLKLPVVSLGLWHNFGDVTPYKTARAMAIRAFDLGITHFDLANNYGPEPGSAELNFGRMLKEDFAPYRDEMIISSKAGFLMWPGPYGDYGSRKYLISSLDQSLKRMGLDYVDIFYHHRPDPNTPLEETMTALDHIVRSGKALYAGISNYYTPDEARKAFSILKELGTPCLIHQLKFNMLHRSLDNGLKELQMDQGVGCITFSPLEKGLLTNRYLEGIPADSRIASSSVFLKKEDLSDDLIHRLKGLNELALERGQTLAQMSLSWILAREEVTSVLIGTSKVSQVEDCVKAQENIAFTEEELKRIDELTLN